MGLDTTHDCWHGPYSSFSLWRNAIAVAGGYEVVPHTYADGTTYPTVTKLFEHEWQPENYEGSWPEGPPEDPLLILIVHSDCDGYIEADHAKFLALRLEQILAQNNHPVDDDRWRDQTRQFIEGLQRASDNGERIEFQ